MVTISFEAETSSGLLLQIQEYLAHLAGFNKAGHKPADEKKLDGAAGFEGAAVANNAGSGPVVEKRKNRPGGGRPKKSREEHLAAVDMADDSPFEDTSEAPAEEPIAPVKLTKEDCVTVLKKVSDQENGINKVRGIFQHFGAQRLSEIDEMKYPELIKVAETVVMGG